MAILVQAVTQGMKYAGMVVGSFESHPNDKAHDVHDLADDSRKHYDNFTWAGRLVNNIVAGVTYRPPHSDAEVVRMEKSGDAGAAAAARAELTKYQKAFNPVGSLVLASCIVTVGLKIHHMVANTFVPYWLRQETKLMGKVGAGAVMLWLSKEAVEGWARKTDGIVRHNPGSCGG